MHSKSYNENNIVYQYQDRVAESAVLITNNTKKIQRLVKLEIQNLQIPLENNSVKQYLF